MGISAYIKEIGRGKEGARALSRSQAADLMGQVLDGQVSDLEIGAFCLAMRIKGETPQEMAGFLDAAQQRLNPFENPAPSPVVVIASYNGSRKLPLLTPLLASLMAREGFAVLVHGSTTESSRVTSEQVFSAMGISPAQQASRLEAGRVVYAPTQVLSPGLQRLLDVRRVVGLRNPAHSLVKMLNPIKGRALLVCSHTHPEYAVSMGQTLGLIQANALLLRGTEGEPVADPRRTPAMTSFLAGQAELMCEQQAGSLTDMPALPQDSSAQATATFIQSLLDGQHPVPTPLAKQVSVLCRLAEQIGSAHGATSLPPVP
jgi:anthranilate phosphoribosyltransferase